MLLSKQKTVIKLNLFVYIIKLFQVKHIFHDQKDVNDVNTINNFVIENCVYGTESEYVSTL